MVVKMSAPGRSFGGVADYCLHDPRMPGEPLAESGLTETTLNSKLVSSKR